MELKAEEVGGFLLEPVTLPAQIRSEVSAGRLVATSPGRLVILQPYSLTAYGLPMARHRVRLAENPFRGGCVRGFLETQLEPIVINPDSLLPPPATADHS